MNIKQEILESTSKINKLLQKKTPDILAGTGIGCFILSTILAVKVTPKANDILKEKKKELKTDKLTAKDTIKSVGKYYIPSAASGIAGICFVSASVSTSNRRYLALSTSYELLREASSTYREKVIETIGEKKEKKIQESISQEKVDNAPPTSNNIILTDKGNTLFRDSLTGQYFRHDINDLKKKALDMANDELCEGYTGVPEWLLSLGLDIPDTLMGMGWSQLDQGKAVTIDFDAVVARNYNDEPCLVIRYDPMPISDYYTYYK